MPPSCGKRRGNWGRVSRFIQRNSNELRSDTKRTVTSVRFGNHRRLAILPLRNRNSMTATIATTRSQPTLSAIKNGAIKAFNKYSLTYSHFEHGQLLSRSPQVPSWFAMARNAARLQRPINGTIVNANHRNFFVVAAIIWAPQIPHHFRVRPEADLHQTAASCFPLSAVRSGRSLSLRPEANSLRRTKRGSSVLIMSIHRSPV
jgi:hypothetical protein